tara:strand:+ start:1320 stop:1457 length:138 start_codon:yes stop_codon:yes gene_type:complete
VVGGTLDVRLPLGEVAVCTIGTLLLGHYIVVLSTIEAACYHDISL